MVDWRLANERLRERDLSARCQDGEIGCPVCRQRYRFGELCPRCDVLLVEADRIDLAPPSPALSQGGRLLPAWQLFRVLAPSLLAALGLVSWLVNHGVLSLPAPP